VSRRRRDNDAGDTHHVFTRGVARAPVVLDDEDYERGLRLLSDAAGKFELECHAWCFLSNHTHLLLTSPLGNLSDAMRWYCSRAAQTFNLRHERAGHVFQGRFGSRLVESERYMLEVIRYIPLNPVRAGICRRPEEWMWSSYAATAGLRPAPPFLTPAPLLDDFGSPAAYIDWIADGLASDYLDASGAPRRPLLANLLPNDSDAAIVRAHFTHGYNVSEIAEQLGTSRSRISRRLARLAPPARSGSDPYRARRRRS
jgi:REP element-mobilizing transposase RayT